MSALDGAEVQQAFEGFPFSCLDVANKDVNYEFLISRIELHRNKLVGLHIADQNSDEHQANPYRLWAERMDALALLAMHIFEKELQLRRLHDEDPTVPHCDVWAVEHCRALRTADKAIRTLYKGHDVDSLSDVNRLVCDTQSTLRNLFIGLREILYVARQSHRHLEGNLLRWVLDLMGAWLDVERTVHKLIFEGRE